MRARCEECDTPLPDLAPGYVIATCRKCRATYHVRAGSPPRRAGEGTSSAPPRPRSPESLRGTVNVTPPNFLVESPPGGLRIGWRDNSLEHIFVSGAAIVAAGLFFLLHPQAVMDLEPWMRGAMGLGLLAVVYPGVASVTNTTWLEVRDKRMTISSGPLPMPRSSPLDLRPLRSVYVHTFAERKHKGWVMTRHIVKGKLHDGRTASLAFGFETEGDAQWLAETLSAHLGLEGEGAPSSQSR